jgi:hypothetical protein
VTNASDVSMGSMSLSRSKVSGVFSANTGTGMQVAGGLPPPPPPAGSLPAMPGGELRSHRASWIQPRRRTSPLLIVLATCLAIGLLTLGWMATRESASPVASALPSEQDVLVEPAHTREAADVAELLPEPASLATPVTAGKPVTSGGPSVGTLSPPGTGSTTVAPGGNRSLQPLADQARADQTRADQTGTSNGAGGASGSVKRDPAAATRPARPARAAPTVPARMIPADLENELLVNPYHR